MRQPLQGRESGVDMIFEQILEAACIVNYSFQDKDIGYVTGRGFTEVVSGEPLLKTVSGLLLTLQRNLMVNA